MSKLSHTEEIFECQRKTNRYDTEILNDLEGNSSIKKLPIVIEIYLGSQPVLLTRSSSFRDETGNTQSPNYSITVTP